jgi:O-antigen/teichoic acid export membrane protein
MTTLTNSQSAGTDASAAGEASSAATRPAAAPPPLGKALVRGSMWTLVAFGTGNALRFASMLALTHLLTPDITGQMVIPTTVMYGLQMFSDLGSGPAIIRDRRGEEPSFLNTAWTMQVIRGAVLCMVAAALGWPLSQVYPQPSLVWLLPLVGVASLVAGFNSTRLFTAERNLALGRLTALELTQHVAAIAVMLGVAAVYKSPVALVAGGMAGATVRMVLSHTVLPGVRNRFCWDRSAYGALVGFGKWIFLGSAVYFVARQGDRLLLGRFVDSAVLGVYGLAVQLTDTAASLLMQLTRTVLLPGLSRVARERSDEMSRVFYKARLRLDALFMLGLGALVASGDVFVNAVLPGKWRAVGGIFPLLCVSVATKVAVEPSEQCIVAMGHTRTVFIAHVARALWVAIGVPLAWHLGGVAGVIVIMATTEVPVGAIYGHRLRRLGILRIVLEGRSAALLGAGFVLGVVAGRAWLGLAAALAP